MPLMVLEDSRTFNLDLLESALVSDYTGDYNWEIALYWSRALLLLEKEPTFLGLFALLLDLSTALMWSLSESDS